MSHRSNRNIFRIPHNRVGHANRVGNVGHKSQRSQHSVAHNYPHHDKSTRVVENQIDLFRFTRGERKNCDPSYVKTQEAAMTNVKRSLQDRCAAYRILIDYFDVKDNWTCARAIHLLRYYRSATRMREKVYDYHKYAIDLLGLKISNYLMHNLCQSINFQREAKMYGELMLECGELDGWLHVIQDLIPTTTREDVQTFLSQVGEHDYPTQWKKLKFTTRAIVTVGTRDNCLGLNKEGRLVLLDHLMNKYPDPFQHPYYLSLQSRLKGDDRKAHRQLEAVWTYELEWLSDLKLASDYILGRGCEKNVRAAVDRYHRAIGISVYRRHDSTHRLIQMLEQMSQLDAHTRSQMMKFWDRSGEDLSEWFRLKHHRLTSSELTDLGPIVRELSNPFELDLPLPMRDSLLDTARVIRTSRAMPKVLMNMVGTYLPWWGAAPPDPPLRVE